jgi:uncharacterized membrane protein YfcA
MQPSYVLVSFLVGVLIGLTSMGGAALMAPFLIMVAGVHPLTAVGTDLVYGALTKIVGAWVHWRQGTVDLDIVRKLAKGSIPGGLVGSFIVILLPRFTHDAQRTEQRLIGYLLVFVALVLLARLFIPYRWTSGMVVGEGGFLQNGGVTLWGAFVGFFVGLTSVGSGSLLAPFLLFAYPCNPRKIVGTDVFHAALLLTVTGTAHAWGDVQWDLLPSLLAGSVPGVIFGSRIALRVPARPLRMGLATVLLVTGVRMM